jgi:hypothetical protein
MNIYHIGRAKGSQDWMGNASGAGDGWENKWFKMVNAHFKRQNILKWSMIFLLVGFLS